MDSIPCAVIFVISALFGYIYFQHAYWKRRGIPHKEPVFLKGNTAEWRKTKHISVLMRETYEQFKGTGPFAGFYFLLMKVVIVLDIDLVRNILIKDFQNFDERGIFFNEVDDPLTGNLFFLDGEKWRQLRAKMSPTFTSGKMKNMFDTVVKVGQELVKVTTEKSDSNIEITDLIARFTADVIGKCAFGLECNSLQNPAAEFVSMGKRFFVTKRHNSIVDACIFSAPRLARRLHMRVIPQDIHDFYMRIVRDTVEYREKNNIKRNDFMGMLIELKNTKGDDGLTIEEVAAQAFVFFLAGFETSSTTMGFVLYELAQHQAVQDKVRKNIVDVLEKHKQDFTYDCMKEMEYLEMVISETLRMHPIVGHLVRRSRARYETADPKYYIEEGQSISIPVLAIHYDAEHWPEPEKFIPERFTAEEIQNRPSGTWLPFGDGPRNCIGLRFGKMQMSIGLAYLLKNFRFSVCPETQIPPKIGIQSFIMLPENGVHLRVEKISK